MTPDKTLKALAHPVRRKILAMLRDGDLTAGEIASRFVISAPSISHHLAQLKSAGLVGCERDGRRLIYSFNAGVLRECIEALMNMLEKGGHRDKR